MLISITIYIINLLHLHFKIINIIQVNDIKNSFKIFNILIMHMEIFLYIIPTIKI